MKNVTVREARAGLSRLDKLLADGDVTITRRGEPMARLVPIANRRPVPSHKALRESMPRMKPGSERLIREERDAR